MKISGSYTMNAPREAVWDRLIDPDTIASCLPGVERLEQTGDGEYSMAMTVGVGMVKGTYQGKVRLLNLHPPSDYQMQVEGRGAPGFVKGTGTIQLQEAGNGTTEITYDGNVEVGGPVGAVAQRMLGGVAKRLVEQFFDCMQGRIREGGGSAS